MCDILQYFQIVSKLWHMFGTMFFEFIALRELYSLVNIKPNEKI